MPTLLIAILVIPLAAAIVVATLGQARAAAVRWVSLLATGVTLLLAAVAACSYAGPRCNASAETLANEAAKAGLQFRPEMVTRFALFPLYSDGSGVEFYTGLDGLNVWLVLLTAFLMVPSVLVSWKAVQERTNEFYAWLLALETAMLGVFLSFDIVLFYVFFELTLVPLFFLIGIWGGSQRLYAARKFFLFTLTGSLITLLGVLGVVVTVSNDPQALDGKKMTFAIPELVKASDLHSQRLIDSVKEARADLDRARQRVQQAPEAERKALEQDRDRAADNLRRAEEGARFWLGRLQFWIFLALFAGFAVKVPLVPLHTWLPLAHTEAPTAGSVLLAGVLLKIGTYGFLRLCVPLVPDASLTFGVPLIGVLAVIGIIYGSFCALAQEDIKKMVAYSSVAHLGFCMLGLFALNEIGLSGSVLQMINHGLSTGALFLLVGMLYERYHTRQMADYGGMGARLRLLAAAFVFITMSSIGLPGLNGFVGEALVLIGMYDYSGYPGQQVAGPVLSSIAAFGVLLGAWYMLTMLRRVFFGAVHEPHHEGTEPVRDLDGREWAILVPFAVLCLFLGLYPQPVLDTVAPDLRIVARLGDQARSRATTLIEAREQLGRPISAGPAERTGADAHPAAGE